MTTPADSPALTEMSEIYPVRYGGRVPSHVRLTKTVTANVMPFPLSRTQRCRALVIGQEVPVLVNRHGAVAGICPDGETLGLKPDEFEVIQFHDGMPPNA